MSAWIKKTTGTTQSSWGKSSKIWVKTTTGTTQSSWGKVITGWVKVTSGTTQASWRKFFTNQTDTPQYTASPSITVADYATTNLSGSQALLGTTLTGNKGAWTSINGTITYSYLWFANGISTGITSTTFSTLGYNGQNITFQVTATNNSGYTVASSAQILVTKNKPVNTSAILNSSSVGVGDTLSINTNWTATTKFTNDTLPDYYIATFVTHAGTITYDSRYTGTWYQYTVLSTDAGYTISAYVTAYNTGAPSGVSTTTLTTNTVVVNPGAFTYSIIDTSANRGPGTPSVTYTVSNNTLYLDWSTTTSADQYREYLNSGPISYTGYYPGGSTSTFTSDHWAFGSSGTESITFYAYNTLNGQVAVTYGGSTNADYYKIYYQVGSNTAVLSPNLSGNIYFINAPIGTAVTIYSVVAYTNAGGSIAGSTLSNNPLIPTTKSTSVTNTYTLTYITPTYTVSWNANGGSVSPTSSVVNAGSSITAPTPTQSGYSFNGWYNASSGGSLIVNGGGSYTPSSNITLYAQWTYVHVYPTISSTLNVSSITTSSAVISWSQTNASYDYLNGSTYLGLTTSTTLSGLSAGTFYSGSVTVYSSTGDTATGYYSFTTATAGVKPGEPTGLYGSNDGLPHGGHFYWTAPSTGTAPITYYFTVTKAPTLGGTYAAYTSGSTAGTTVSVGAVGYFKCSVYASNAYGTSSTVSTASGTQFT